MKITEEMIKSSYKIGKQVYEGSMTRQEGKEKIAAASGMNPGSASDYIQILSCMLDGRVYKRAMSLATTRYFLDKIGEDFGRGRQVKAARAVVEHTEYYALHCKGRQVSTLEMAQACLKGE